jgi:hypothetical protein
LGQEKNIEKTVLRLPSMVSHGWYQPQIDYFPLKNENILHLQKEKKRKYTSTMGEVYFISKDI